MNMEDRQLTAWVSWTAAFPLGPAAQRLQLRRDEKKYTAVRTKHDRDNKRFRIMTITSNDSMNALKLWI